MVIFEKFDGLTTALNKLGFSIEEITHERYYRITPPGCDGIGSGSFTVEVSEEGVERLKHTIIKHIARNTLGIPTLETRNRDSLDFHDVSVWLIEAALVDAFNAGRNSCKCC